MSNTDIDTNYNYCSLGDADYKNDPNYQDDNHLSDFEEVDLMVGDHADSEYVAQCVAEIKKLNKEHKSRMTNRFRETDEEAILEMLDKNNDGKNPPITKKELDNIYSKYQKYSQKNLTCYRHIIDDLQKWEISIELRNEALWIDGIYAKWSELEYEDIQVAKKTKKKDDARQKLILETRNNKQYKCEPCSLYTNNASSYKDHLEAREHFVKINDTESLAKLSCLACTRDDFFSIHDVNKHKETLACSALRTCPTCSKVCSRKQTHLDHIFICESKQKEKLLKDQEKKELEEKKEKLAKLKLELGI